MTVLTVPERVAAGASWLDEHAPGWWQRINPDALLMESCQRCVLGQLFGDFNAAPLKGTETALFGFDVADDDDDGDDPWASFDRLGDAWRELIAARRAAVSTVGGGRTP